MSRITRRDFLKLGSIASAAAALARHAQPVPAAAGAARPGILIFVFDALSAKNLSLYGYHRKTSPNLERLARRATVYNQHYSAANFTSPGTASLLTGLYPWTHRAINFSGLIARSLTGHNLFRVLGPQYYRLAFSQNMWANYFLGQFSGDIEKLLSPAAFSLVNHIVGDRLPRDLDISHRVLDEFMLQGGQAPPALVFGVAERLLLRREYARAPAGDYEQGLPHTGYYPIFYTLKDVFEGMRATVEALPASSLAYLHDWAPHAPYRPSKEFNHLFADGWKPPRKPEHLLGDKSLQSHMNTRRQNYDEFVANLDFEFGRLLDSLEAKGILDSSYVIVTSDHGEMFERGVEGHSTPLLYEPVVRVPLLISSPGQAARRDIDTPTSSVDLLPTLAHLAGLDSPAWSEGQVLPGLGGPEDGAQSVFMMDAKYNPAYLPLTHATFALRKASHKLIYYMGFAQYGKEGKFELYDIASDPEELNDLYSGSLPIAQDMRRELLQRVQAENARMTAAG